MAKKPKLHKNILVAYSRIVRGGGFLSRQHSNSTEAMERGGGFIYFASQNNQQISPTSARFLIEKELVKPVSDGLFEGQSQSFEAVSAAEFNHFKELYEQV